MKKICFYLTTRGNYAKTKTIIDGLKDNPEVQLQYIAGGGCPDMDFYGTVRRITMISTGNFKGTYKTAGLVSVEVGCILDEFMPDILVIVADRFECLPVAMIAYYMGIPIVHLEGGEQSKSIDDGIRNAITQLATLHFPCTENTKQRIVSMGIDERSVYNVGATSLDMMQVYENTPIEMQKPYLLVIFHTSNAGYTEVDEQFSNLLWALSDLKMETHWIRPNIDTDSDLINFRLNKIKWPFIHVTDSVKIENFAPLMANAACIVGNSSSGVRESSFLGIPAVNVGDRQANRERAANTIDVPCQTASIIAAINKQIEHGKYEPDYTYGDGHTRGKIVRVLLDYLGVKDAA